jgi:hypothetical protein
MMIIIDNNVIQKPKESYRTRMGRNYDGDNRIARQEEMEQMLLEKLRRARLGKNVPEIYGSFLCSQEATTGPDPEPHESSPIAVL